VTATEWVAAYAAALGVEPPTAEEFDAVLALAAEAAHASERTAAPVACWLAGREGVSPDAAVRIASEVAG
jgi:hypothetical protein